jgi:beta-N-acetylhexosaminidase
MPWGMTAHITLKAIDPDRPATLSPAVVADVIRGHIGFGGLLLGDDISMKALAGKLADLARQMLAAGCDIVMHCNGKLAEMTEIAGAIGAMAAAAERLDMLMQA